jgi:hypothetical protein
LDFDSLTETQNEAAELKLLRPLTGYALFDHKTNDSIHRELQTDCILDKTTEGTGFYTSKECHKTESL